MNGATFASWLPRIPEVRDRLDLSLGTLGFVLLGTGLGGLASSAVGGLVVDRVGSRRGSVVASLLLAVGLPVIGLAPSAITLGAALFLLGALDAVADISMNVQAADVQGRSPRSVMQRFHAAWSVGTVAGAATAAGAAALGVGLTAHLAVTSVVLVASVILVVPHLSRTTAPSPEAPEGPGARRGPVLALLAALAAVVAVVEGAPGEWAAVYVTDVHDATEGPAGLAFVAVSVGMVLGRVLGDRATDRLGHARLFTGALGLVAAGLVVVIAAPSAAVAVVGFGGAGLGISVLFPALYLQAATTPQVPAGLGVGVMSSGARVGFLVSPVIVGGLSQATSLRVGLGLVVGVAIAAALVLGPRLGSASAVR